MKTILKYRKLRVSDYLNFKRLFYNCFGKKVSFEFYKWRYFSNNQSFCYGVFDKTQLIGNVGMVVKNLNDPKKEKVFSRHSSMINKKYRGNKIFSDLLKKVKNKIKEDTNIIVMWPNDKNFSDFGIDKKKIIKNRLYLYKSDLNFLSSIKTKDYNITKLKKFKSYIISSDSLFIKNYLYYKQRYLNYRKFDYILNMFESRKLKSFYIIKKQKYKTGEDNIILDHFGSQKLRSKHFSHLISEKKKYDFFN